MFSVIAGVSVRKRRMGIREVDPSLNILVGLAIGETIDLNSIFRGWMHFSTAQQRSSSTAPTPFLDTKAGQDALDKLLEKTDLVLRMDASVLYLKGRSWVAIIIDSYVC
jgi:hypothetical protein